KVGVGDSSYHSPTRITPHRPAALQKTRSGRSCRSDKFARDGATGIENTFKNSKKCAERPRRQHGWIYTTFLKKVNDAKPDIGSLSWRFSKRGEAFQCLSDHFHRCSFDCCAWNGVFGQEGKRRALLGFWEMTCRHGSRAIDQT